MTMLRSWGRRRWRGSRLVSSCLISMLLVPVLIAETRFANAQSDSDEDRLSLLYMDAKGDGWVENEGWKSNDPICDWFGITCDDNDKVTSIRLPSNNLIGKIPPELYEIETLKVVDLQDNEITDGGLSGMKESKVLEQLYFAQNSLATVEGIGDAPDSLTEVHFTQNLLAGPFPVEITQLTKMQKLYLSFNKLTGTLPTSIGKMTDLEWLYLYDNLLTGQMPTQIGNLGRVEIFTMAENLLSGSIPKEIESMLNLKTFSLHNNREGKGRIGGRLPLFKDMPKLTELYLDGNEIEGTIPSRFLQHTETTLSVTVGLSNNNIEGSVPTELGRFSNLNIDLVDNMIEGFPEDFCDKKTWMNGLVEEFGCDAILCPAGFSNGAGRQESDDLPCEECAQAEYLGSTSCVPEGSDSLTELQTLATLFVSLRGPDWTVKDGWQSFESILVDQDIDDLAGNTQTSYCELFHGISCNDDDKITAIELPDNRLIGELPHQVFKLTALKTLNVARNSVTLNPRLAFGALAKSTTLDKLILAGTKVDDVTGIGAATSLRNLVLDGIDFVSPMPADLFKLTDLERLHCEYSSFTGTLPTDIGDMTGLKVLNLYGNELVGSLPSEIGRLVMLHVLELSENKIMGELPEELGNLGRLEKLHFHQAEGTLSGPLPSFASFAVLTDLELDSNSFTGAIPSDFLAGVTDKRNREMNVGLSFNNLGGGVPKELREFDNMNIRLEGNEITNIPLELCNEADWMDGEVGKVGSCDAIMCPPNTWNLFGKATSRLNATCMPCPSEEFYGSTYCGSETNPNPEMRILDSLYDLTGGRNWTDATNWTTPGVGICHRLGIVCGGDDDNSGVIEVHLQNNGLQGLIPPEIYRLPDVRLLGFSHNEVELDFFGIEHATKLQTLQMSNTKLRTLDRLSSAPDSLAEIHLADNQIEGMIPNDIYLLHNVRMMFLQNNLFTGELSSAIGDMISLTEINLSQNRLKGGLPTELGLIGDLKSLKMSGNEFFGPLPSELIELPFLQQIDLSDQRGSKRLSGPLPSFDSLSAITKINLSGNDLIGSIPEGFLSSAAKGADIIVNLAYNELTGPVPVSLNDFQKLRILLEGNKIDDLSQELCDGDNAEWMGGTVGTLGTCDAILCPPGTALELGRQSEAGTPCETCPAGTADAPYYGSVRCTPDESALERQLLEDLYRQLNGTNWITQTNWVSKRGVCTWFGITCEGGEVIEISLESNNLESVGNDVSELLFALPKLRDVDLKGNFVPLNFQDIPVNNQLTSLKLSDTGLATLEGLGRASSLHRAHFTNNALPGEIPPEIFTLTNLRNLFMSYNSFTGTLSADIANLSNLIEFYMFENLVSGTIPTEVGKLTNVKEFIMSRNQLKGAVPTEFSSLPKLEQLSLYDQQGEEVLSGPLPTLEAAPLVWYFDVSSNDMTGVIPVNFMENSAQTNQSVTVNLSFNEMQGAVPATLDKFAILDLGIVGNKFTSIPDTLCDNPMWMMNAVGAINSCDAIACARGSYTTTGKQEAPGSSASCLPCGEAPAVSYVGQTSCGGFGGDERDILERIYANTGGDDWTTSQNWNSNSPICTWSGVNCTNGGENDDSGVTSLDLDDNNLVGRLPSETFMLPSLEVLKVGNNPDLRVAMDGLAEAQHLELLYVSRVNLPNINGISAASELRELHLTGNGLTGTLPDEIFELTKLNGIFLAYNLFSGVLSTRIAQLTNLVNFYAFDNDISGEIPSELGSLSSLEAIVLSENLLSGSIPVELSSLPRLRILSLYRNAKSGPKLFGSLPSFDQLPLLRDLYLDRNDLTGTIPQNFISASTNADVISLGYNRLSGAVSSELDFLDSVNLQLEANEVTAFPMEFCDNTGWMDGGVGDYGCDAFLCPPSTASVIGRKNGTVNCDLCDSSNTAIYYGSVTCDETKTEKRILNRFYQACGGSAWYKRQNWAKDDVEICDWYGISCDATGSVIAIQLSANNVVGTLSDDLFDLPRLQFLDFSYNPIDFSFDNIGSAKNLFELKLDGVGLSSLDGVEKATGLIRLDLNYNTIETTFPEGILSLTNLRILNMANNRFAGPLPDTFSKLRYLRTLRLGSNSFNGPLPSFEDMNGLTIIDLSDNKLRGPIPGAFLDRISPTASVQVNLAENHLTGTVPDALDRFTRLTIYLRQNMIVGLPASLCDNSAWNGGTVETFGCDAILCPPGTASALGRQRDDTSACQPCADESRYYGETVCESSSASRGSVSAVAVIVGAVSAAILW